MELNLEQNILHSDKNRYIYNVSKNTLYFFCVENDSLVNKFLAFSENWEMLTLYYDHIKNQLWCN